MDEVKAKEAGLYQEIDQEIDDAYMAELKKQSIHPEVISEMAERLYHRLYPFAWNRKYPGPPCIKGTGL